MTNSRAMFAVGKAAAIATATIKTAEGAQSVFASAAQFGGPFGWILAPVAAAAAWVVGMKNVHAIRSTSFGSGGGGMASMPAIPALPQIAAPAGGDSGPDRVLNLTLVGHSITMQQMQDEFIPLLNEAADNGVTVIATVVSD